MSINTTDFAFLQTLVRERSAIVLDPGKEYLAESRLAPIARGAGLPGIGELVAKLRTDPRGTLTDKVIEAMTTNETSFFRDAAPFEGFRRAVLPKLIEARSKRRALTIWSAACSTGQEPYSLGMMMLEHFPEIADWSIRIVATDLATTAIAKAKTARYRQLELNRGLPAAYLVKYFDRMGMEWEVKPKVRRLVEFSQLNLIGSWPATLAPDVVFLRNVLIYFDRGTKASILSRIRAMLPADGALFLGAAETPIQVDDNWDREAFGATAFYRRRT